MAAKMRADNILVHHTVHTCIYTCKIVRIYIYIYTHTYIHAEDILFESVEKE
jgi:hypothetical protein